MLTFALIGAAGYIAPRHMKAMAESGGKLIVAYDPNDSVGIIDTYFPDAAFFVEFERFDRHLDKMRRNGNKIDYVSVCSPNYLHDAHCRFAMRSDANAICEKPVVLNPWNIDGLEQIEKETSRKVSTILQLRLHPTIQRLKDMVDKSSKNEFAVDLTYITSRGPWYQTSWKGDDNKSGGIATNIGVHFFDMLIFVFGSVQRSVLHQHNVEMAAGYIECERAKIRWFLSISAADLPENVRGKKSTFRSITLDGQEIEFSEGFTDLHTASYKEIVGGRGYSLADVRPSIELVSGFRSQPVELNIGERHPFVISRAIK